MYPLRTAPDRLDDASLFPHVSARYLLDHAAVQLPIIRYRGFRPDPPPVSSAAAPGLAAGSAAAGATSSTIGLGVAAAAAAAAASAASAAWRLQQRLEFIQFEERIRRVSGDAQGDSGGGDRNPAGGEGGWRNERPAAEVAASGDSGAGGNPSDRHAKAGHEGAVTTSADSGGETTGVGRGTASAATAAAAPVAAAKRLVVVLAEYIEDKTTIGMVIVDQPGTGMTTALLGFLDWYCKGAAAGGRQVGRFEIDRTIFLGLRYAANADAVTIPTKRTGVFRYTRSSQGYDGRHSVVVLQQAQLTAEASPTSSNSSGSFCLPGRVRGGSPG